MLSVPSPVGRFPVKSPRMPTEWYICPDTSGYLVRMTVGRPARASLIGPSKIYVCALAYQLSHDHRNSLGKTGVLLLAILLV
jgi:hypothetical protein